MCRKSGDAVASRANVLELCGMPPASIALGNDAAGILVEVDVSGVLNNEFMMAMTGFFAHKCSPADRQHGEGSGVRKDACPDMGFCGDRLCHGSGPSSDNNATCQESNTGICKKRNVSQHIFGIVFSTGSYEVSEVPQTAYIDFPMSGDK